VEIVRVGLPCLSLSYPGYLSFRKFT
jgi:hypothetical protein